MSDFKICLNGTHSFLSKEKVEKRLIALGRLENKKVAWIRSDLSLSSSNWLERLVWSIAAKFFSWMRTLFYGIDLEESRSHLLQIGLQIRGDAKLSRIFLRSLAKFSEVAPSHGFIDENSVSSLVGQETLNLIDQLLKQDLDMDEILEKIKEKSLSKEELLILVHSVKADASFEKIGEISEMLDLPPKPSPETKSLPTKVLGEKSHAETIEHNINFSATLCNMQAARLFVSGISFEEILGRDLDWCVLGSPAGQKISAKPSENVMVAQKLFGRFNLKIPKGSRLCHFTASADGSSFFQDFKKVIKSSLKKYQPQTPFAINFIRVPESVLVIVKSPEEFWIFNPAGNPKTGGHASLERFFSAKETSDFLHDQFPYLPPSIQGKNGYELLHNDFQNNGFTAHVLIRKE